MVLALHQTLAYAVLVTQLQTVQFHCATQFWQQALLFALVTVHALLQTLVLAALAMQIRFVTFQLVSLLELTVHLYVISIMVLALHQILALAFLGIKVHHVTFHCVTVFLQQIQQHVVAKVLVLQKIPASVQLDILHNFVKIASVSM